MIHTPVTLEGARAVDGEYRAGGTDVHARRRIGVSSGDLVDLAGVAGLDGIEVGEGRARVGALTRITTLATHPEIAALYPALAATAGSLATPQVRAVATVGGNLLQRTRCPYFRRGDLPCLKAGGTSCGARHGDHRHGVVFDESPCVTPHPSSLAMALLLYDARLHLDDGRTLSVAQLLGGAMGGYHDHALTGGEVLTAVELGGAVPGESAAYRRVTGRALAEWPIVEAAASIVVVDGTITTVRVAAGAVAPLPRRLPAVEDHLVGGRSDDEKLIVRAASAATAGAEPLPMTAHKVALLRACVRDVVASALAGGGSEGEIAFGEVGLSPRP